MIILWNSCLILLLLLSVGSSRAYKRVCYHTNWAQYRPEPFKFFPGDIDPSLCTHVIYSFGKVVGNTIAPYEWNDESTEWSKGKYEETADLKKLNPNLKILLAIGGWTHGSDPFTALVDNKNDMELFAQNAITYLRRINFDGLDLDWEYPANRGSPSGDKQRFTDFCKILRRAFEDEAQLEGKDRLLLTAAVAAGEKTVTTAYEIGLISKELDFINLMSYDLHGSWEKTLGHNSPLYARSDETGEQTTLNQDYAVQLWLNGGTPKEKLIMGMGLYGRSFTMGSASHTLGSPASGAGVAGTYTREAGFLAYYEVCKNLKNGWTRVWSDEHKVPYAYKGDQWVGYDDAESIEVKANYVKQHGLGGSMVWAMDLDDFNNNCSEGVNPLMTKLMKLLPDDNTVGPTQNPTSNPTQAPTAQPTQAPTDQPTQAPTAQPTQAPTQAPTAQPTQAPTAQPTQAPGTIQYKRVCYHTNWAQYRPDPYKFFPEDIDPSLCTHIMYSFGEVVGNTIAPYEWNDESTEWSKGMYEKTADLKKTNPDLKVLLAIGGWSHGVQPFTALVDDTNDMELFAQNVITYLRRINFDGLDLDWEYPANRGSPSVDKQRFTELCTILRRAFEAEPRSNGQNRLLLTAAVAAGESTVNSAYEINLIARELDFINLMSYDLHGSWENFLGHQSALYPRDDEIGNQRTLNQDYAVRLWLNGGVPPEKLIMGLGLYGRSFRMGSTSHAMGSVASGAGAAGTYTREAGFLSFYEICSNLANGWTRVWNDEHKVPYAYKDDQWVGYDDLESIEVKVNYIKAHGLGGSMVWAMALDDFKDSCGYGKSPLMSKIKSMLKDGSTAPPTQAPSTAKPTEVQTTSQPTKTSTAQPTLSPTSSAPTTAQPTQAPTTAAPTTAQPTQAPITTASPTNRPGQCGPPEVCPDGEYFGDACEPAVFYQCWQGIPYKKECQGTLIWDSSLNICNWDYAVNDNTKKSIKCEPDNCVTGDFHGDKCEERVYYQCWNGKAFRHECAVGTKWDGSINNCIWA